MPDMPESDPLYLRVLEKLGFNVTRLRWKIYKLEQRRDRLKNSGVMPERLRWITFRHKICRQCGAVNDRDDKTCYKCERRLPSLLGYRVGRLFGFMIPESAPHAIIIFLALSVLIFGANILLDGPGAILSPSSDTIYLLGGFIINGQTGAFDWWRAITFGVVHGGIIHIAFNCYAMTVLASLSEANLGARRTLVTITVSQLGAAVATWFWYLRIHGESVFTVGASGWVSGLLGYAIVYTWFLGDSGAAYRRQLTQWAVYILLFGYFMGANNVAHIGGALAGAAIGVVQNRRGRTSKAEERAWDLAFWASAALWVVCLGYLAVFVFQNVQEYRAG